MPMTRRDALAALGAAVCASAEAEDSAPEPLRVLAERKGLAFGSAVGRKRADATPAQGFDDPRYRALLARECAWIVPENELKWQALRPTRGEFRFEAADAMRAWAREAGLRMRGHTLLWHDPKWLPDWVNRHRFGAQPVAEAEAMLAEHVRTVCTHCGPQIASWDVVNESVQPDTGTLRDNAFTPHLGNIGQIELAFRVAHEHAPQAQLVYNDFMTWGSHSARHRAGVLELLKTLTSRGVPVHALGLQSHLGTGADGRWVPRGGDAERDWRRFLDEVASMGLSLLITELDVNDRYLPADVAQRDAAAATMVRDYLDVCLDQPGLHTVMTWAMADPVSWMQTWWPRADGLPKRPSPYDGRFQAKPMREAIAAALRAAPSRPPA